MRVSIWQQFSSNHSGWFTVVGTLESAEKANTAAAKLSEIIQAIHEWHQQHPGHVDQGNVDPIPPEVEFARQYGVKWDMAVDWFDEKSPVSVLDDNVVVLDVSDTWSYPLPFLGILKQLGGSVVYSFGMDEPFAEFRVKLTCTAPDETVASDLATRILAYLPEPWEQRTPWYPDDLNYDEIAADAVGAEGTLRQLGQALAFELHFFEIAKGLPALIQYLQSQGCTGIEYQFVQGLEVDF